MAVLVVPPHGDFTVELSPTGEGTRVEVLDLGRRFVGRVTSPDVRRQVEGALLSRTPDAANAQALLSARAASQLLERGGSEHTGLRAVGALLAALSAPPSPVRLRLDDLELSGGTTERSLDVVRSAAELAHAPYAPELEEAASELAERAGTGPEAAILLWVERDLQLPAAVWLTQRLGAAKVQWTGPFARHFQAALQRVPALRDVRFGDAPPLVRHVVGGPGFPREPRLTWRAAGEPLPSSGPWGGELTLGELARAPALVESGLEVAVIQVCAADETSWVGPDGVRLSSDQSRAALRTLGERGVHRVAEWWVGAPGIGRERLDATFDAVLDTSSFDALGGVRAFHWAVWRAPAPFDGGAAPVLGDPPADRDLARTRPFPHPSGLSAESLPGALEVLAQRLQGQRALAPGRVAQAFATPTPAPPVRGERVELHPDCALVPLPWDMKGQVQDSAFAVHLARGAVLALSPRLVPLLLRLREPSRPAEALGALGAQAEKLVRGLIDKQVLREVAG